jgi:hypothetical protein
MPDDAHTRYGSFGSDVSVTLKDTFDLQSKMRHGVLGSADSMVASSAEPEMRRCSRQRATTLSWIRYAHGSNVVVEIPGRVGLVV